MIPIFILTCDRLEVLKKSMQSYYDCIKAPFELVIIDFGSTYEPTVEFLKELESNLTKVYWMDRITTPGEFSIASDCIEDYFKTNPKSNYIVTDPDVELDNAWDDVLYIYSQFLLAFPDIHVVGPMLRIDDIPDYYPFKDKLINGKMGLHKQFYSNTVHSVGYEDIDINYIFAPIDTTFGMYRAGTKWSNLRSGIRVFAPYSARHLDWYIDPDNLTPDQEYYMEHASNKIAHWSKLNG